jgi:hypothetical protein
MRSDGRILLMALLVGLLTPAGRTPAQEAVAPASDVKAEDHPNDIGDRVDLEWSLSPHDIAPDDDELEDRPADLSRYEVIRLLLSRMPLPADGGTVLRGFSGYEILRRRDDEAEFTLLERVDPQQDTYEDRTVERGRAYEYQIVAVMWPFHSQPVTTSQPVVARMQWFRMDRGWLAIIILTVCSAVVGFIAIARSGRELYVRKIPGLEAVDEAVGRATEMGRSCVFVPGIQDINDIQTVAGLTVLSRVSTLTAEYGADLKVPTSRSLVMTTARETVSASYLAAGHPDAYREDDIYYLTDEQFGYVASVTATMMEEKPAACFYMGAFYAESLILAETGNAVGAIQVAGTAQPSQLPFFVAACDYTLIGEEFFAASAYLSGEPVQLGSLRGQDIGKLIAGVLILVGVGLASWAQVSETPTAVDALAYVKGHILGSGGFLFP